MKLKIDFKDFKDEIKNRKIEFLVHFTPTINLLGILENKEIMSRAKLESLDIDQFDILDFADFPDDLRLDDKNYINLSLSSPNTFLLERFRNRKKDNFTLTWCILKIDPKYIYYNDTLFSVTNAASNAAKNQFKISGDFEKFKMLFREEIIINTFNGARKCNRDSMHPMYPTDVQAEILIKDKISSEDIISVCFTSEQSMAEAKAAMSNFNTDNFIVDKEIFSPKRYV